MYHVMVDLETLGTSPNSAILSIGAVSFTAAGTLEKEFYVSISPRSSKDAGFGSSASTREWWSKQSPEAQTAAFGGTTNIEDALRQFSAFAGPSCILWGNGASFDNVILANAYDRMKIERPWKFWNDRCYRTLKAMFPYVTHTFEGVKHNALDDARNQAIHACKIFKAMGTGHENP